MRLRSEIERCGYTLADAARAIGDPSSQNLRDVVSGRKKCPAELVGRLAVIGVDILHVLTGSGVTQSSGLAPDESALLDNYRHLGDEQREAVFRVSEVMSASCGDKQSKEG